MSTQHRNRHNGFTLVEVLVAIAILAVLAALAFVVSRQALAKAARAKAVAPLRQVAAANMEFAMENNGQINTLRWIGDPEEGKPFVGNSFWGRLQPHLFPEIQTSVQKELKKQISDRLDQLFATTDADTMAGTLLEGSKIYHDSSGLPVPFAFNDYLYTWNDWENVHRVGGLAQIAYITYGFGVFDEDDGRVYVERPTDGSKPENNIYYLDNRQAMVAFLDGHVEFLAAGDISQRKLDPSKQ